MKVKCSRDITVWNLSRDVTWQFSNRNISRALHFQAKVLIWFWISVITAFQWYITWPYLEKKNISPIVKSCHVTTWRHKKTGRGKIFILTKIESSHPVDYKKAKISDVDFFKSWFRFQRTVGQKQYSNNNAHILNGWPLYFIY